MADRILYLFPDTNLFIQCRELPELDWERWGSFDEIHLIISRPVQKEIDKHKNRGNDRIAKRARRTASLLRGIIAADGDETVARNAAPLVRVIVRIDLRPDPNLENRFDYGEPDDRLVGIAHAFALENSGADVRVLTHDGGPLASAKMVGVVAEVIPDEWLLPPEASDAEKKVAALEGEIVRLKKTEPKIALGCRNADGGEVKELEIEVRRYLPVTIEQLLDFTKRIRDRFPIVSDFGSPDEQGEHPVGFIGFRTKEFVPATVKQISDYPAEYAKWLEKCAEILRSCHVALEKRQNPPRVRFWAENIGTRPAKDTLVTIAAKGELALMVPEHKKPEEDVPLALPRPPRAPRGTWIDIDPFKTFHDAFGTAHALGSFFNARPLALDLKSLRARDPNAFYYKPRPEVPVSEVNLECSQWRHGLAPEEFEFEIRFDRTQAGIVKGALEFRIHAENLSGIERQLLPVRITIREVSAYETAKALVQQLTQRSGLSALAQSTLG